MNRFAIHCTEEQTKKAFELGAPIEIFNPDKHNGVIYGDSVLAIPTAEEMIGWIDSHTEIMAIFIIKDITDDWFFGIETTSNYLESSGFNSRKEATIAAIDEALDILSNKN